MCSFGCLIQFPESIKLFKFSLLIPPSTSGIGCGFSAVNLIITPLQTNHNKANRILICVSTGSIHSVLYFFFLHQSPPSSLCTVFDAISFNINVLSIYSSATVFVFVNFNICHKDWLAWWNS